jgi:hypothetical protein
MEARGERVYIGGKITNTYRIEGGGKAVVNAVEIIPDVSRNEVRSFTSRIYPHFTSKHDTLYIVTPPEDETYLCYIMKRRVPRSKHSIFSIKTNLLMLYEAKIYVCSEIQTKHTNAMLTPCRIF